MHEFIFPLRDGAHLTDDQTNEWTFALTLQPVSGESIACDYQFTWTLAAGTAKSAAVGVEFSFPDWLPENFVFVPAAVYDGNRFALKSGGYPPYWYDPKEWRLNMPTTMASGNPTLGRDSGPGRIRISTGNASVPLMAFQSPAQKRGWIVETTQECRFGNYGLNIEESVGRTNASFAITAPADSGAAWKTGDSISIRCRVYSFPAADRAALLRRFLDVRKDINPTVRGDELPYSAAWQLLSDLYQNHRWDDTTGIYWLTDPAAGGKHWNSIWQLGWCGGGQATLPLLMRGDESIRQRVMRNLEVIFTKSQAASGFLNAIGNGEQFASFGFGSNFKYHECLVRSQGDWLYMAQRQFGYIEAGGGAVPAKWKDGLKKLADAFANLWDKRGQFGQFVNVETGDLCIGGSTSGGIVPGALALASKTFNNPHYLKIAEESARNYHRDFVQKGYTTGGPGEILSAPDSESAFGLFESYMALYEVTGGDEWLHDAGDLLPICASWTVAYDYQFPADSIMARIQAHSCGAVWASVANKHGAPGICTWSGDSLLKYFRATGDRHALDLLADIAHGLTQYISRADRPVGKMPPGGICERVNLSDWEGRQNVGGNIFGSCSWVETAALLTVTQLPGLYVQPDTGIVAAFDNICAEKLSAADGTVKLRLTNPTKFPADVTILVESASDARKPVASFTAKQLPVIHLDPGAVREVECGHGSVSAVEPEKK